MPGVKTNEREGTRAVLRHSRMSASKVRQVLDLIRGQDVDRAAEILSLGDREAAVTVGKVLASAVANAVHNDGLDAEELYVSACYADEGSTLKRWRPRARGRATRIRKRTSHITIIVSRLPEERIARRRAQQAANTSQRSRRVAGSAGASRPSPPRRPRAATEVDGARHRRRGVGRGGRPRRRRGHRDRGRPAGGVGPRAIEATTTTRPRSTKPTTSRRTSDDAETTDGDADEDTDGDRRRREGQVDGPEGKPVRVSTRRHHRLEVALVRGAQLPELRDRGLGDPRLPDVAARVGRGQPDRDRADP